MTGPNPNHMSTRAAALSTGVVGLVVFCLGLYLGQPTLSWKFAGVYGLCLGALVMPCLSLARSHIITYLGIGVAIAAALAVSTSSVFFRSADYALLLGKEHRSALNQVLPNFSEANLSLVTEGQATVAMQKALTAGVENGKAPPLSSPVLRQVHGHPVWLSFIETEGFFAWREKPATPGYVTVSAADITDVRIVKKVGGKPLALRYRESAYGFSNASRHIYWAGMFHQGLTAPEPALDEQGHPFYAASVFDHTIGFSGDEVTGAVTLDAQTGEVRWYAKSAVPAWVDRIQPAAFVTVQIDDRWAYLQGFLPMSDDNRLRIETAPSLIYGRDRRAYWLVSMGLKSPAAPLTGFYAVDALTKQVSWIKNQSLKQPELIAALEALSLEKKLAARTQVKVLFDGEPTVFATLEDGKRTVQAYAFMSLNNKLVAAYGDTLANAHKEFEKKLALSRFVAPVAPVVVPGSLEGVVLRIGKDQRSGVTTYYLTVKKAGAVLGTIFSATAELSEELALTNPGDVVRLTYPDATQRLVPLSKFVNTSLPTKPLL